MNLQIAKLPFISEDIKEVKISRKIKNIGEFVKKGEPLVEVETDGVIIEVPSEYEGKIIEYLVENDQSLVVNDGLCNIYTNKIQEKIIVIKHDIDFIEKELNRLEEFDIFYQKMTEILGEKPNVKKNQIISILKRLVNHKGLD